MARKKLPKTSYKFYCDKCDYGTSQKSDYNKHLKAKKHLARFAPKELPKTSYFHCEECSFTAYLKQNYDAHCQTKKHLNRVNSKFKCDECPKTYKTRNGLLRHKKKHVEMKITNTPNEEWKQILIDHMKENNEIQKQLVEIAKEPKVVNHYNNTTTNNNNTFNVINYLNTECKDAYNITDFIKNLVITFEDLERIEQFGYLHGVKTSLIQALKDIEQTKRPIHCTDVKRKQFYVKDEDIWTKDKTRSLITKTLNEFNNNQMKALMNADIDWKTNDRKQDQMNKLLNEITQMYMKNKKGDLLKERIVAEISNATVLDKSKD
jgi:hypothetical protein